MRAGFSVLTVLLLDLSLAAADDERKGDESGKPKPKLTPMGMLTGKITDIAGDGRKFVIEVEGEMPYWSRSSSPRSKTPPKVRSKKEKFEVEVTLAEDAKVRLPIDRDDDDAKKSAKDKDSKDPDAKLPGRAGAPDDLKKYQVVTVSFAATKEKQPRIYGTLVLVVKDRLGK